MNTHLQIALEPEASAIYCKHLQLSSDPCMHMTKFDVGTRYMIVDCGGTFS